MAFIYDLADTWNNAAVTFTGIKLNVTDSASAAGSLLMDLHVGGVSRFRVDKTGSVTSLADIFGGGQVGVTSSRVWSNGVTTTGYFGIASANPLSPDTILTRDAANTLALRNGVNPQAFNLYNTYTDASNYERGFMRFVSNELRIGTDKLGTGTARALAFQTDGVTRMTIGTTGSVLIPGGNPNTEFLSIGSSGGGLVFASGYRVGSSGTIFFSDGADYSRGIAGVAGIAGIRLTNGSTGGGALQLQEMTAPAAPAADNVRIYAEDDGAGKTRLMARFATGAAVQIAIEP